MRAWLPLLLLLQSSAAVANVAQRDWRLYQSAHFNIYTDVRPREMARTVRALEIFRAAVANLTAAPDVSGERHPTRLILFARLKDFHALVPQQDIIGYMVPGLHYNLMVAAKPARRQLLGSATEVIFHEYVHDLVRSASSFRYPTWYDEGLAEVLSTARLRTRELIFGHPPGTAQRLLADIDQAMPLTEMLEYAETLQASAERRVGFYTKAWLLTHYLLFSADHATLSTQLSAYLQAVDAGQPSGASFAKHFGVSPQQMDETLRVYSTRLATFPMALDTLTFDPAMRMRSLTRAEANYELGDLYTNGNPALANQLLQRIPADSAWYPRGLGAQGRLAQRQGQHQQGLTLLRRAVAADPQDALLPVLLGNGLLSQCRTQSNANRCTQPVAREQALEQYRAALTLTPKAAAPNARYGHALIQAGRSSKAIAPLRLALERVPGSYEVVRALGMAHLNQRQWQAARYYLQRIQGWASDAPQEQARITRLLGRIDEAIAMEESP